MENLGKISSTLFVPLQGRVFVSENLPHIFYDKKAIDIKSALNEDQITRKQSQYTMVESASRSAAIDEYIEEFIQYNKEPVIVELGAGLETTYYRCKRKPYQWYCLDLPKVIKFRHKVIGMEKISFLPYDFFDEEWTDIVRSFAKHRPILFIASGIFQYFMPEQVRDLLILIQTKFKHPYVVFDCFTSKGLKRGEKYMKLVGCSNNKMYFYIDDGNKFLAQFGEDANLIEDKPLFKDISRKGCSLLTRMTMDFSDLLDMVKIMYIKL